MRKDGVKFACLCLDCFATSEAQALQEALPGDFWVERPWQGFDLSTWAREIGTWRIKEVTESEVFVWVTTESSRLDVQDGENEALSNRLHTYWKGLQLSWPCTPRSAWILTGSLKSETADVSSLTSLPPTFDKTPATAPTPAALRLAAETAVNLEAVFAAGILRGRLERGLTSFLSGMKSLFLDETILAFERTIEGIVHPSDRKQFVNRCLRLLRLGASQNAASVLEEIYVARNAFTHALPVELAFPGKTTNEARHRAQQLQALLYWFTSEALRVILADKTLVQRFGTEGQGPFWGDVVEGKRTSPFVIDVADDRWQFAEDEMISS